MILTTDPTGLGIPHTPRATTKRQDEVWLLTEQAVHNDEPPRYGNAL